MNLWVQKADNCFIIASIIYYCKKWQAKMIHGKFARKKNSKSPKHKIPREEEVMLRMFLITSHKSKDRRIRIKQVKKMKTANWKLNLTTAGWTRSPKKRNRINLINKETNEETDETAIKIKKYQPEETELTGEIIIKKTIRKLPQEETVTEIRRETSKAELIVGNMVIETIMETEGTNIN